MKSKVMMRIFVFGTCKLLKTTMPKYKITFLKHLPKLLILLPKPKNIQIHSYSCTSG